MPFGLKFGEHRQYDTFVLAICLTMRELSTLGFSHTQDAEPPCHMREWIPSVADRCTGAKARSDCHTARDELAVLTSTYGRQGHRRHFYSLGPLRCIRILSVMLILGELRANPETHSDRKLNGIQAPGPANHSAPPSRSLMGF